MSGNRDNQGDENRAVGEVTAVAVPAGHLNTAASDPSRVANIAQGFQIGEYVVEGNLGRGAFGSVYAGVHPVIGKRVAIKVLSPLHSVDPTIVARFLDEARAVNTIGNPNIVDIFSFGQLDDGRHYFVMERLDGQSLGAYVRESKRLDLPETIEILAPVARALSAAHAAGIAHRDLKPDNIFLGRGEGGSVRPKLLDFGVAKLLDDSSSAHATETGITLGTPAYMSPEQCVGKGVDERSDIYAFGVLVYRMLTGALPFEAESGSQMMAKHLYEEPRPPQDARPDLPAPVGDVILWMLTKDKASRPQTILEAFSALETAARGDGNRQYKSGINRAARSSSRRAILVATAVAAMVGGSIWLTLHRSSAPSEPMPIESPAAIPSAPVPVAAEGPATAPAPATAQKIAPPPVAAPAPVEAAHTVTPRHAHAAATTMPAHAAHAAHDARDAHDAHDDRSPHPDHAPKPNDIEPWNSR